MSLNIYTIDDHPIIIERLHKVIDRRHDMNIIGSAGRVETALAAIAKLKPDVVLLDLIRKDRIRQMKPRPRAL